MKLTIDKRRQLLQRDEGYGCLIGKGRTSPISNPQVFEMIPFHSTFVYPINPK